VSFHVKKRSFAQTGLGQAQGTPRFQIKRRGFLFLPSKSGGSVIRETIPSLNSDVSDAIAVAMFTKNERLFGSWNPPRGSAAGPAGLGHGLVSTK
jgi:hypothetical protein